MKFRNYIKSDKGQSMFEILIAMTIATLIVGSAATAIIVSLRSGSATVASQKGYSIANETLNNVRSYAESNWADLYTQTKGEANQYHLAIVATTSTSSTLGIATGTETIAFTSSSTEENISYTSWFTIDNVLRSSTNWIAESGTGDPTTQKITAHVSWGTGEGTRQIDLVAYVSKVRTRSITFDDWSGSSGVTTTVTRPTSDYYSITGATITEEGNITY